MNVDTEKFKRSSNNSPQPFPFFPLSTMATDDTISKKLFQHSDGEDGIYKNVSTRPPRCPPSARKKMGDSVLKDIVKVSCRSESSNREVGIRRARNKKLAEDLKASNNQIRALLKREAAINQSINKIFNV